MTADANLVKRTDAKLRYARLHLDELRIYSDDGGGGDWEKAHEESVLFHLVGAKDAFLQEINSMHRLGLDLMKVNEKSLTKSLKQSEGNSASLVSLEGLATNPGSWYSQMIAMHNFGNTRHPASRLMKLTVGDNRSQREAGCVNDPAPSIRGRATQVESLILLEEFFDRMEELVNEFRNEA